MKKLQFTRKIHKAIEILEKEKIYSCDALNEAFELKSASYSNRLCKDYKKLFVKRGCDDPFWLEVLLGRGINSENEEIITLRTGMLLMFKEYAITNELFLNY